ncbi:MAG TPA: phosphatidate cytidylyltransferase [Bacteroidia bacterium]|jgi:phosphatidate cytidylyltransferase|nr:phosphatidate cytidylyltransferase [Bacteroidia bacterium]
MLTRAITGAVFLLIMISAIVFHQLTFAAVFLFIIIVGLHEFFVLLEKNGYFPQKWTGILIGSLTFGVLFFNNATNYGASGKMLALYVPAFFMIFLIELFRTREQAFANIALTLLGIFYISVPMSLWNLIVVQHGQNNVTTTYNWHYLLGYFFLVWSVDTGGYMAGKAFGKHKLWERHSPKKTWEGSAGSLILSVGVACAIGRFYTELTTTQWVIVALITTVLGSLGDLVESMFKRSIHIKDSGSILPGHGGILDRFDGVFMSSPFVVAYMIFIR